MNFADRNRAFLAKMRALPEHQKKIVLWTVVIVLTVTMGYFWITGTVNKFSKIGESVKSIKLPVIDTSDLPKMPDINLLQTTTPTNK